MKWALVTGGAGFIGHHLIQHLLVNTDWGIVCLDRLDTSGNLNRLSEILIKPEHAARFRFVFHDLKAELNETTRADIGKVNYIFHLAAGSHVDRSITDPLSFVMDNVVGSCNLFNYARSVDGLERLFYFSTDEVFGCAPEGVDFKEWDRYNSTNPYSASKAGAEELAIAFRNTYNLPIITTHCVNVFGERQHPEKYIPLCINRIDKGEKILIHSHRDKTKAGSRFYIHARNVSAAVLFLVQHGVIGEKYNITSTSELSNLEVAQFIADALEKPLNYEMVDFHSSRPGHDLRYSLDGDRLKDLGFEYQVSFEDSMLKTIKWTMANRRWM